MKQKILKSFLCLSLSAAMIFGEAGGAFATTIADTPEVEAVAQTQTVDEPEMTEEGETAEEAAVDESAEEETAEAAEAVSAEETAETEEIAEDEAAQAEETTEESAEGEAQQEETDDVLEALGAKIVGPTVLADVEAVYDEQKKILSWNKVAGAATYEYEISYVDTDGDTGSYSGSTSNLYYDFSNRSIAGRVYTVKISAINRNELYVVAEGVYWGSKYDEVAGKKIYGYYDSNPDLSSSAKLLYQSGKGYDVSDRKVTPSTSAATTTYTLYKYPASAKQTEYSVTPWTTAEANAKTDSVTALAGIALVELRGNYAAFKVTPAEVKDYEMVYYSYSNNEAFQNDGDQLFASSESYRSNSDLEFSINTSQFIQGETIYVRARTYNSYYTLKPGQTYENRYSAPVTTTYTVPKPEMADVDTTVTGSSVRLEPLAAKAKVTGFEYQRKNGKKWITIAKQGSAYTDEGLKEGTKYTYRVRGYSYNERTKKTTYTAWKQVSAYTWGAALNLKASAASATSVKLKWSKIPKADGYEIYRCETGSDDYSYAKGECKDEFDNLTLIKTIKKAKTASYTDKKLTKGNSYKYLVRAYRTIGKNKCYIEDEVNITLSAKGSISDLKLYYNASGNPVVTWDKATGISGYKVDKGNPETGKWEAYKELGKTATTITLPSISPGSASVKYRIRSYNGDTIYKTWTVTVEPTLPAVKNVKAVQTPEGVQVTWSPVAGADYYEVIRTTKEAGSYDETTKLYGSIDSYSNVVDAAYDVSSSTDLAKKGESQSISAKRYEYNPNLKKNGTYLYNETTSYSTKEIKGTSVVDKKITVQQLIYKEDDPTYNKAADPERYTDSNGNDQYVGDYGDYAKNADGSLKTRTVTMAKGPEAGNTYYYYVRACTEASNGANKNGKITYSIGYTKGAQVTYTAKTAKATKLSSVKSKKKATVAVSTKKVKGAKGYAFYRSTKKNGTYVRVGTSTKPTYTDTNVTGGKTYYYKTASYALTENGSFVYSKLSAPKKVKVKK